MYSMAVKISFRYFNQLGSLQPINFLLFYLHYISPGKYIYINFLILSILKGLLPVALPPTMTKWFSGMTETVPRCKEVFSLCVLAGIGGTAVRLFMKAMERILFAAFTCILALGGSIIGTVAGGIKGQTTEAGFLDGAGKGAVTGAIAAIELMNFGALDDPLSEVLLSSLLNGKVFMEWICPAVAQAYQLHINTAEEEVSDIYDIKGAKGMPQNHILKLPFQQFNSSKMLKLCNLSGCSICFQDFEDGELIRILPKCSHLFHLQCIDKWLAQQGSCPMCRTHVSNHIHEL